MIWTRLTLFCILCSMLVFSDVAAQIVTSFDEVERQHHMSCASDKLPRAAELAPLQQEADRRWQLYREQHPIGSGSRMTYSLPVVFHIVHNGGSENISDEAVQASLDWMNAAFANMGYYDQGTGGATDISFCLAKQDPNGDLTTGINRVQSPLTNMDSETQDQELKDLIRWDPLRYINIWIVKEICGGSECGVAGYAYLPTAHGQSFDGIVLEAQFVGATEAENSVLIHEMGHYLGLYHTFEGGCVNDDCTADGDQVCDTPPDATTAYAACGAPANSCATDANDASTNNPFRAVANGGLGDQVDMHENFMDYSDFACYHAFTQGQADRMEFFITDVRYSLLESMVCNDPCPNPMTASINAIDMTIDLGTTFSFTGTSTNASNVEWKINNIVEGDSENLSYLFDTEGNYTVIYSAYSDDILCSPVHDTVLFSVICPVTATFSPVIDNCYSVDTTIVFSSGAVNSTSIEWFLNDTSKGTSDMISITFGMSGLNEVMLVATNGICQDTFLQVVPISCNEICDNGFDDDADGLIDYYDPDCCGAVQSFDFLCDDPCYQAGGFDFDIGVEWNSQLNTTGWFSPVAGDIDADGVVELVFLSGYASEIAVLDGRDGTVERIFSHPTVESMPSIAIADLNNDGFGEIINTTREGLLAVFDHLGNLLYESDEIISYIDFNATSFDIFGMNIQVADFNQDGNPEIYLGNRIFNGQTGQFILGGGANNNYGFGQNANFMTGFWQKYLTMAIDILPDDFCPDCDGLELVAGSQIYSVNLNNGTMTVVSQLATQYDGFSYVADFDLDGDLDVIYVTTDISFGISGRHHVKVWDGQSDQVISEWTADQENPSSQVGGLVVGNLDDDPALEICMKVGTELRAIDNDMSLMWVDSLNDGSAVEPLGFDFNLDGTLEIAMRDDLNFGIYHGATGDTLFMTDARSGTVADFVAICDVDADGSAEVLMDTDDGIKCVGILSGQPWAGARPVFNQPHYYNIHISDDLSVPPVQQNPLLVYDEKFMNNSHGVMPIPQPSVDATLVVDTSWCSDDRTHYRMTICNEGISDLPAELHFNTYCGSPEYSVAVAWGGADIGAPLAPDDCQTITIEFSMFCDETIYVVLNDDESLTPPFNILDAMPIGGIEECNYENNIDSFRMSFDPIVVEIQGDTTICEGEATTLFVTGSYSNYLWNTNATDSFISVTTSGWYWLEVSGNCGQVERDSIFVQVFPNDLPVVDLGNDTTICTSSVLTLSAPTGPYTYQWSTGETASSITIWSSNTYRVTVSNACGAQATDAVTINMVDVAPLSIGSDTTICAGDSVLLQMPPSGLYVWSPEQSIGCKTCQSTYVFPTETTTYTGAFTSEEGCVVFDTMTVFLDSEFSYLDTMQLCAGDSVYIDDIWVNEPGNYTYVREAVGCDSLITTTVVRVDTIFSQEIIPVCQGDSVIVNGLVFKRDTVLNFIGSSQAGCDSVTTFIIDFSDLAIEFPVDITIDAGQSTQLEVLVESGTVSAYAWTPADHLNCDDCPSVESTPPATITYTIQVIDENGCTQSQAVTVNVIEASGFYIPTAFSPNGDAVNDRFLVFGNDETDATYTMKIYNRWGGVVFNSGSFEVNDTGQGWNGESDGKPLNPEVFVYQIFISNGEEVTMYQGDLELVR